MGILFLLIAVSSLVAVVFLIAFIYSVKSGQFDDIDTPARRMLLDDYKIIPKEKKEKWFVSYKECHKNVIFVL